MRRDSTQISASAQNPAANRLTVLKCASRSISRAEHLIQQAAEHGADQADDERPPKLAEHPPPQDEVTEDRRRQTDSDVGQTDVDVLEHEVSYGNAMSIEPR